MAAKGHVVVAVKRVVIGSLKSCYSYKFKQYQGVKKSNIFQINIKFSNYTC